MHDHAVRESRLSVKRPALSALASHLPWYAWTVYFYVGRVVTGKPFGDNVANPVVIQDKNCQFSTYNRVICGKLLMKA